MNRIDHYKNPSNETFRDPEAIENQMSETRHRMDNTLEKLGEKLDPREYISAAGEWADDSFDLDEITAKISSVGNKITTGIKNNPVPTALVGAAAVMLLIPRRSKEKQGAAEENQQNREALRFNNSHHNNEIKCQPDTTASGGSTRNGSSEADDNNAVWESISEFPDKATAMAKNAGQVVAEKTRAGGETISSTSRDLARKTGETASRSKRRIKRSTQETPGLFGAGALAVGFLAALALPRTRKENELCGETSDQLKAKIKDRIDEATPSIKELKDSSIDTLDSLADEACDKVEETIAPENN